MSTQKGEEWSRVGEIGGALEVVAENEELERLTAARQELESLEQRLKEAEQ